MAAVPVDLRERMEVLFWQEMTSYKTEDYLSVFYSQSATEGSTDIYLSAAIDAKNTKITGVDDDFRGAKEAIKEHWREIICEWAYNCKSDRNVESSLSSGEVARCNSSSIT